MPILPENRALYPGGSLTSPEWREIRARSSAGWPAGGERCECAGECGLDHGPVARCECAGECGLDHGPVARCEARNHRPHPVTGSRVVLTIAHLDQDPGNNGRANLKALCQRCHNRLDAPHRARHRAENARRRQELSQLKLY